MADTRWSPYLGLAGLQAINRMFADVLGFGDDPERTSGFCVWRPPVDIIETGDAFVLHAELPGVDRENISIEIRDNVLKLAGDRKPGDALQNGRYLRSERKRRTEWSHAAAVPNFAHQLRYIRLVFQCCRA